MSIETLEATKQCGLCGRTQSEVDVLVAGVSTYVCDLCISRGHKILSEAEPLSPSPGVVEVLLNPGINFTVDSQALLRLLEKTSFAMGENDERQFLNGVLFEIEPGSLRAVATNGHYLAMTWVPSAHDLSDVQHMILARTGVLELQQRLSRLAKTTLNVQVRDNQLLVTGADMDAAVDLVLGNFPNYRDVIFDHPDRVALQRSGLLALVHGAPGDADVTLHVRIGDGSFDISVDREDHWQKMPVERHGAPVEAAFNRAYLQNMLQALEADDIEIGYAPPGPAWHFAAAEARDVYLLMAIKT